MKIIVVVIVVLCQSCFISCRALWQNSNANLSVDLQSRFPSDSLTHQAAEYFASLSDSLFWDSIEHLSILSTDDPLRSDRVLYEGIVACEKLSSSEACSTLKMSLGLNAYSPLLESNRQLLRDAINGSLTTFDPISCKNGVIVAYGNQKVTCGFDPQLIQTDTTLETFDFDHVHPNKTTGVPLVVFGNLDQPGFVDSHQKIVSCKENFRYILRLSSFDLNSTESFPLNGFGVELAFKNMEYNVLDDSNFQTDNSSINGIDFGILKERYPSSSEPLDEIASKLRHELQEELRVWDIANFGSQAVQYALDSNDTLSDLAQLACDFPRHALKLKSVQVDKNVQSHILTVHGSGAMIPGESSLFLNGIAIDTSEFDIFALQSIAVKESKYIEMLSNIGLNSTQIDNALQNASGSIKSKRAAVYSSAPSSKPRLDTRSDSVSWMNDLETGAKYRGWHRDLSVMKMYSGQFSLLQIRRNLYNCVAVIDPSKKVGLRLLDELKQFVKQNAPVRVGVVFDINRPERNRYNDFVTIHEAVLENEPSTKGVNPVASLIARLFHWALGKSRRRAFSFLSALAQVQDAVNSEDVSMEQVKEAFLAKNGAAGDINTFNEMNEKNDSDNDFVKSCIEYVSERNIATVDTVFFNGVQQQIPYPQLLQQMLIRATYTWQSKIMHAVHLGSLSDEDDISSYLFEGSDVVKTYSDLIQLPKDQWKFTSDLAVDILYSQPENLLYLSGPHKEPARITIWMYADLDTKEGASLALGALRYLKSPNGSGKRIAFITYGPSPDDDFTCNSLVTGLLMNAQGLSNVMSKIIKILSLRLSTDEEPFQKRIRSWSAEDSVIKKAISTEWIPQRLEFFNGPTLIVNGRIIEVTRPMVQSEFGLLNELAFDLSDDLKDDTNKYMLTVACLGARMRGIESLTNFDHIKSVSKHYESSSHFKAVAVISPLSEACQFLVSVLLGLRDKLNWDIKLIFNPPAVISSMPIKRYYRYVFQPEVRFDLDGKLDRSNVKAVFALPPKTPVLTLSVETTEPWLVESSYSEIDLDNMQFYEGFGHQRVTFDLKNLLVYGTCLELSQNPSPPAGLKLLLESSDQHFDTIVMENVGYFQLKSSPNVFDLKLAPGKATEMFMFPNKQQLPLSSADLVYHSDRVRVPVRSFTRSHLQLFLSRRPGMEMRSLLELTEPDATSGISGFWNSLFRSEPEETIHIFSIASGHLYERFLRIMMLSVAKRMSATNYKIKFWFVGQFLSPQFKVNIHSFAEKYGFSVELVTYKWPSWLRRQREKQRTIWGYKILFLDVLFPINLDRIIFIDADQVVRGDLSELWNLDLKGNPYAYTPFCDSNAVTEGFRFWKGGFWKEHLRGRPYHISALYVVDLKQFRKIRAGDTLRAMYDNLSADPNSLANLDQDLPNYAQHVVGIYSLPQEWLWCETWCSMESLDDAKTIDLCNNPMTKEPKLSRARRLLPEWNALNEEANPVAKAVSEVSSPKIDTDIEKTEL